MTERIVGAVVHDAVVLVGGRGSRLGGVDKAAVNLAGRPLLSSSLHAARGARTLVVVGSTEAHLPARAIRAQEDPPGSGPAAGFAAGLCAVPDPAPWTLLLSCDIPGADAATTRLLQSTTTHATADGVVLTDPDGRPQWSLGLYRTDPLRQVVEGDTSWANRPLRALFDTLTIATIPPEADEWEDVDTWEAHARWRARLLD